MAAHTRRDFLRRATTGLAVLGAGGLTLPAGAQPTPASGDLGDYAEFLKGEATTTTAPAPTGKWAATEDNILGPYHREGAPFRAKVTPPLEPGDTLVVNGRVWALDTRKPIAGVVIDIWQANAKGRYDNDDRRNPPAKGVFKNRCRLITDEQGYYEYETIHPGRYLNGRQYRPAHIHYLVRVKGYRQLVTQLYFKGDPMNDKDPFIKPSLIIEPKAVTIEHGTYKVGTFDIVLPPTP